MFSFIKTLVSLITTALAVPQNPTHQNINTPSSSPTPFLNRHHLVDFSYNLSNIPEFPPGTFWGGELEQILKYLLSRGTNCPAGTKSGFFVSSGKKNGENLGVFTIIAIMLGGFCFYRFIRRGGYSREIEN